MALDQQSCAPCRGGTPPLTGEQAKGYMEQVPKWTLSADGKRIGRAFSFDNFRDALRFVNRVGELAEEQGHHPEITFGWGYARIEIWTHKIDGLHENDFILAAKIDRL
ncbi:putative pterin-4-alpha-carbinolamine dehydratase [Marinobacterium zhoushanense]|uniref:4a-hydroxytetrahydrobiopterin dehydratase n=1 Tax=Marinobacterium zhoushanense TaxID=1679163 RepID=A0ABQ1KDV3_9GAMM|nr:4a-hydroxytetrahydrobiopterin dehydratase [Marinobacterium zhoushanense]GGB93135.1 putative pterin-4-alpha-carbinolamine dehydratase [Marinobacterium zhoushanense]